MNKYMDELRLQESLEFVVLTELFNDAVRDNDFITFCRKAAIILRDNQEVFVQAGLSSIITLVRLVERPDRLKVEDVIEEIPFKELLLDIVERHIGKEDERDEILSDTLRLARTEQMRAYRDASKMQRRIA